MDVGKAAAASGAAEVKPPEPKRAETEVAPQEASVPNEPAAKVELSGNAPSEESQDA